jgi:hypothetical protein
MKRSAGRKLSSRNLAMIAGRDPQDFKRFRPSETIEMNRHALSVPTGDDTLDDASHPFFQRHDDIAVFLSEESTAALDAMMENHGLANLLQALAMLLDSRVNADFIRNGSVMHHLARDDAYAHAAERVRNLTYDPKIKALGAKV